MILQFSIIISSFQIHFTIIDAIINNINKYYKELTSIISTIELSTIISAIELIKKVFLIQFSIQKISLLSSFFSSPPRRLQAASGT
jgi:hypothetical protein